MVTNTKMAAMTTTTGPAPRRSHHANGNADEQRRQAMVDSAHDRVTQVAKEDRAAAQPLVGGE